MQELKIGLIGLGTIGQSLLHIIRKEGKHIHSRSGCHLEIVHICDRSWEKKSSIIGSIPASDNPNDIFENPNIDVVVELVGNIEPAQEWFVKAWDHGKAIVTANKALLAAHGNELLQLAYTKQCELCFEAAVGGAMPLIQNFRRALVAERIDAFYGILNGTSNFILSKMEKEQMTYEVALGLAQKKGYAEANPESDVGGRDAAQKLAILAALAFNLAIVEEQISTTGISNITLHDIQFAHRLGYCIRPLSIARYIKDATNKQAMQLSVHPAMLPKQHLLSSIQDSMNVLLVNGLYVPQSVFIAPGAGGEATAMSVISDLVFIARKNKGPAEHWLLNNKQALPETADIACRFYLHLQTKDRPGVLAQFSQIIAEHNISIAMIHQEEHKEPVDIVAITHKIQKQDLSPALKKLNNLDSLLLPVVAISIEEEL